MTPYYRAGGITLYHGRAEEILPQLPAKSFDLIFTSPPYNAMNTAGHGFFSMSDRHKWTRPALANGYDTHPDKMPHEDYVRWQRLVLLECWRTLSDDGAIFYNHKPRAQAMGLVLPLELIPASLPLRQIVTWVRAGGMNYNLRHYAPMYEWILILAKPAWKLRDQPASGAGDVWSVTQERDNPHPAPFPIELPLTALETTGAKRVCDPHVGSGTTMLAARKLGCEGVGVDVSAKYLDWTIRRLEGLPAVDPPGAKIARLPGL